MCNFSILEGILNSQTKTYGSERERERERERESERERECVRACVRACLLACVLYYNTKLGTQFYMWRTLGTEMAKIRYASSRSDQIRYEIPQKLTQLSPRSHPRHLVGKRTAQKDAIKDTTSDSQVNSCFPYRWPPALLFSHII